MIEVPVIVALFGALPLQSPPTPVPTTQASASADSPRWRRYPIPLFPAGALSKDLDGDVILTCQLDPERRLTGCVVVSETPENEGFGEAALAAAADAAIARDWVNARGAADTVTFLVRFRIGR